MGFPLVVTARKEQSWREIRPVAIWGALGLAIVAGAMIPFQAGVNVALSRFVGGPSRAAFLSFAVGTVALLVVSLLATRGLPNLSRASEAPWWVWIGGLLGAFYVFGSIVSAPRLGAVTLIAAVFAGQAVASLVIDHYGWVGFPEQAISPARLAGIALLAAGLALVRT
jgi:bacterial/archaeal transporter family-2 protein